MEKERLKIGLITSGGDSPGMNAAIRAVTLYAINKGFELSFIYGGIEGILKEDIKDNVKKSDVAGIGNKGGTMLYTGRYPKFAKLEEQKKAAAILKKHNISFIIIIGGDGSFHGGECLGKLGIPYVGIPGTIDNNIANTDETLGFDTCLNNIAKMVDQIRDTATSHDRCMVIEIMGGYSDYLTLYSAIENGADYIITPKDKIDFDNLIEEINNRKKKGKRHTLIFITEWITNSNDFAKKIEKATGIATRACILGFSQRGGSPSARDRELGVLFGTKAVDLILANTLNVFVNIKNGQVGYSRLTLDTITDDNSNKSKLYEQLLENLK